MPGKTWSVGQHADGIGKPVLLTAHNLKHLLPTFGISQSPMNDRPLVQPHNMELPQSLLHLVDGGTLRQHPSGKLQVTHRFGCACRLITFVASIAGEEEKPYRESPLVDTLCNKIWLTHSQSHCPPTCPQRGAHLSVGQHHLHLMSTRDTYGIAWQPFASPLNGAPLHPTSILCH